MIFLMAYARAQAHTKSTLYKKSPENPYQPFFCIKNKDMTLNWLLSLTPYKSQLDLSLKVSPLKS